MRDRTNQIAAVDDVHSATPTLPTRTKRQHRRAVRTHDRNCHLNRLPGRLTKHVTVWRDGLDFPGSILVTAKPATQSIQHRIDRSVRAAET